MYKHPQKGLFRSVYVDDLKMAGKKENIKPMWAEVGKHIDLEPAVPFHRSLYLGAMQEDVVLPKGYIEEKQENYEAFFR